MISRMYGIFVSLLLSTCCFAQSSAGGGTIQGTIKDISGATLPLARLQITHVETGEVIRSGANGAGFFSTPPLKIGRYKVRVEATGMKAWESELTLETGHIETLEPVLSPGQVSDTVEVTDSIPLVTTTEPTNAHTLDAKRIEELPINGRNLNTLIEQTSPGVEQVIDVNGGVRSGGLMVYGTGFVQDGAPSNNREFGGSMNQQGLDSIGEVRVETSTSSARYNTPTSVVVTTKSGTNRIHGSLYETARNNAFGVARARQDVNLSGAPYQTPKLIRNEFGGTIGGPVFLPSFGLNGRRLYDGRNRTFFVVSREGTELREGLTKSFSVPTVAMRGGDFSGITDTSYRPLTIYDPRTTTIVPVGTRHIAMRTPFPRNIIPASLESPLAKTVWGFTPLPSDSTDPVFTGNLRVAVPTNGLPNLSDNPTTVKIDHRVGKPPIDRMADGIKRRPDLRPALRRPAATDRAGAGEMVIDLPAHDRRADQRTGSERHLPANGRHYRGGQLDARVLVIILRGDEREPDVAGDADRERAGAAGLGEGSRSAESPGRYRFSEYYERAVHELCGRRQPPRPAQQNLRGAAELFVDQKHA